MATTTTDVYYPATSIGSGGGGIYVPKGHSGISSLSPISTLERQYSNSINSGSDVGSSMNILLFIKTNGPCCLQGGVEQVLKNKKGVSEDTATVNSTWDSAGLSRTGDGASNVVLVPNEASNPFASLESLSGTASQPSSYSPSAVLSQAPVDDTDDEYYYSSTTGSSITSGASNKGGGGVNRLFKMAAKVATKTVSHLERQMQTLAVKVVDQERNPDQFVMALYRVENNNYYDNNATNTASSSIDPFNRGSSGIAAEEQLYLISVTEPQPLTASAASNGLRFTIPLTLPVPVPVQSQPTTSMASAMYIIKLWIRSGATGLLGAATSKYHYVGSTPVMNGLAVLHAHKQQQQQQQQVISPSAAISNYRYPLFFKLPFVNSPFVSNGEVYITAVLDTKYANLCGRGWSLTDPIAAQTVPPALYNPTLHQSYGFQLPANIHSTLHTIERSTESTVVLPIAAAVANLCSKACLISLNHSISIQQQLLSSRHDIPALFGPYVDTVLSISHFQQHNQEQPSSTPSATFSAYWQRPNSIFEVELIQMTRLSIVPNASLPPTSQATTTTATTIQFYPKPLRHGILPSVYQAYGGTVPSGTGFFLGSIRFQIEVIKSATNTSNNTNYNFHPKNPFATNTGTSSTMTSSSSSNIENPFDSFGTAPLQLQQSALLNDVFECIIPLEHLFQQYRIGSSTGVGAGTGSTNYQGFPVMNMFGEPVGNLFVAVQRMEMKQNVSDTPNQSRVSANGGLTQVMGLDYLASTSTSSSMSLLDGILPALDYDEGIDTDPSNNISSTSSTSPEEQRRRDQLRTMGSFLTTVYLDQHINTIRRQDCLYFQQRSTEYMVTIQNSITNSSIATMLTGGRPPPVQSHIDRTPRAFRPSSSRQDPLLGGIPFNVHTATLALDVLEPSSPSSHVLEHAGAVFTNITCGAPSDHARGFSNVFATPTTARNNCSNQSLDAVPGGVGNNSSTSSDSASISNSTFGGMSQSSIVVSFQSPVGAASGGLRRLESKRVELAQEVSNLQTHLIMCIGNFFVEQRRRPASSSTPSPQPKLMNHIPARDADIQTLRWKVFEAVQCLHHLTWTCAVRRASVFSQALSIAITSYLSSVSDPGRIRTNWPEVWVRNGYLLCYEGLLSAVGKELGMMEDASTGISMLRTVQVVFVPDDGTRELPDSVPVPNSPYIRWIHISSSSTIKNTGTRETGYLVQIGTVKSYYDQRIPAVLQNGTLVRLYPLLFEVGVDIRQWSANTGTSIMKRGKEAATAGVGNSNQASISTSSASSSEDPATVADNLDDEDEDTTGTSDTDVLVQLNYEAFQKMNEYAFAVAPPSPPVPVVPQSVSRLPHPYLSTLYQHIVNSAGRMNHDILDEAATLAQQLGGGGIVFCKSGKDRTAMHVTYKQAQFVNKFRNRNLQTPVPNTSDSTINNVAAGTDEDSTYQVATLLRIYGTRLPICEKNVGQAKYAFNSLQVKFMPEPLKPPMSTLAGFLKGGNVFGGGPGIES